MTCWKCHQTTTSGPLCADCGAILQPPPGLDHFAALGLPRRYELEPAALEQEHRQRSREVHPDRFARAAPLERRLSLLWATAINDAYKTLRDPARRAEYLLGLHGVDVTDKGAEPRRVAPAFLMEIMERREALAAATAKRDTAQVEAMAREVRDHRRGILAEIATGFADLDDEPTPEALEPLAGRLAVMRYYNRFLEEVAAYHEAEDERS